MGSLFLRLLPILFLARSSFSTYAYFELNLTWETYAPDGNPRQMVLMNRQFPGPPLNLNYGDQVEFVVHNYLPQPATIHFHGIEQIGTSWSDGVPGVSQKPIPTGGSFTYNWTALQHGAYWYHGHARGLIQDGLYGPIIIQPAPTEPSPYGAITNDPDSLAAIKTAEANWKAVMISDWTKYTSEEYLAAQQDSNLDLFCVDSILINGKGSVNCEPLPELNKVLNPNLGKILQASNLTISDKGCTPLSPKALTQGDFKSDPTKVPYGLQDGCEATDGSMEVFSVDASEEWANFHFISAASSKAVIVSIDEHPMWVYAVDGSYIEPQLADTLFMYNGERFSVMVKLDKTPGDYTMRVANNLPDQLISGLATISYNGGDKTKKSVSYINYGGVNVTESVRPLDLTVLVPYNQPPPAATPDETYILKMGRFGSNWQWTMNNISTYGLDKEHVEPLLFNPDAPDALNKGLSIRTKMNTWVDVVLEVTLGPSNPAQPPHPIHKHSNKGYIIGRGDGSFNYSSVAEAMTYIPESFNIPKAQLRDSFTTAAVLQAPAWIAFRYHVTNVGAFLLHCHIQTHLNGGMGLVMMDGVDAWPEVPAQYLHGNGCL